MNEIKSYLVRNSVGNESIIHIYKVANYIDARKFLQDMMKDFYIGIYSISLEHNTATLKIFKKQLSFFKKDITMLTISYNDYLVIFKENNIVKTYTESNFNKIFNYLTVIKQIKL